MGVRASVRVRTTAAATLVVAVALAGGAVVVVLSTRDNLTDEVRTAAELRAGDVASALEDGTLPATLTVDDAEEVVVQVVDGNGTVVAASANVAGRPPVAALRAGTSSTIDAPIDDDRYLAVAVDAQTAGGRGTVIVARSLDDVDESTLLLAQRLAVGVPLLTLLAGATTWLAVGRALAPVAAIRREVDAIEGRPGNRRVTVPDARDEIARLARTMNQMLDRLERAQARQRRFVADASHELRSPVASIRQHAEVALAHPEHVTLAGFARTVLDEDLRMQRLVDDLLVLARADEGMLRLDARAVDLDDVVLDEVRHLRAATRLSVDSRGVSAGRIRGDADALARVVRNLADNAARHAHSTVALAVATRDGAVILQVDDDGPGIAPADRERVLERFVRLDEARSRGAGDTGLGLGLAIVAELVGAHGGRMRLTDSPLGGVRVEVSFAAFTP